MSDARFAALNEIADKMGAVPTAGGGDPTQALLNAIAEVAGPAGGTADWDDITNKPPVIAAGADAAAARTAIGLGTVATLNSIASANITDGTIVNADINASAAIALSKLANVAAGTDGLAAGTLQATLQALATRIQALEDAAV